MLVMPQIVLGTLVRYVTTIENQFSSSFLLKVYVVHSTTWELSGS
jgi:hypothetical protein